MKRPKKAVAPKAISYLLIPPDSDIGKPMYERLYGLVDDHHDELSKTNVRIALAWATSWKADVDGRLTLGKCKKASELDRELAPYDFVILLNRDFWQNPRVSDLQRTALLDHELMHAAVAHDDNGDPKEDEAGRTCYRIRKHDLEEFVDIVNRHGCYKRDIEAFAQAIVRAEQATTPNTWISFTATRDALAKVGVDLPLDTIAMWSDEERRAVVGWALISATGTQLTARAPEGTSISVTQTMPECLAAALETPAPVSH